MTGDSNLNSNFNTELEQLAKRIVTARLDALALFILEAHRPLVGIFHGCALFISPVTKLIFRKNPLSFFETFFSDSSNLDLLAKNIEQLKSQ